MLNFFVAFSEAEIEDIKKMYDGARLDRVLVDSTFDVASKLETTSTLYLQQRVYSQPESKSYRRTGTALGSVLIREVGENVYYVLRDTRIKWLHGSKRKKQDYAPYLNQNSKIGRLNTFFWDDAVEDTQKDSMSILLKNIDDEFSK